MSLRSIFESAVASTAALAGSYQPARRYKTSRLRPGRPLRLSLRRVLGREPVEAAPADAHQPELRAPAPQVEPDYLQEASLAGIDDPSPGRVPGVQGRTLTEKLRPDGGVDPVRTHEEVAPLL